MWKGYPAYPTDYTAVTDISLDITATTLHIGDTATLTATVAPDNATNKDITWNSSNPSVATVADGIVTAVSIGTATITAATADGRTAVCAVTVEITSADTSDVKITVQPRTTARRLHEIFGAGTAIKNKDGITLSLDDFVGTGSVMTLPNGNQLTVAVTGDLTGSGNPDIADAKIYLESLVGNSTLDDIQKSALEDIVVVSDSAIKKLRSFLSFIR